MPPSGTRPSGAGIDQGERTSFRCPPGGTRPSGAGIESVGGSRAVLSKAFTKEDDDGGVEVPVTSRRRARLTRHGASVLAARLAADGADDTARALLEGAEIVEPAGGDRAALGARVRFRDGRGRERAVVLVGPDEVGVVPGGVSAFAPLGQALVGASAGDDVVVETNDEELSVLAVDWPG